MNASAYQRMAKGPIAMATGSMSGNGKVPHGVASGYIFVAR